MKKTNTILSEIPHTEQGLRCYLSYVDKAIKECNDKVKELIVAKSEALNRLVEVERSKKNEEEIE